MFIEYQEKRFKRAEMNTLSVCMITYNHEFYIREAIESVIKQKTSFRIELVIGEDCSTDKTRDICILYKAKYPDKIELILNKYNLGAKNNFINILNNCQGKYIAICEGDDYWTDPHKLQKQVEFMEANPDYGLVFSDADHYHEREGKLICGYDKTFRRKIPTGDVLSVLLQGINPYKTCTSVFRSKFIKEYEEISKKYSFKLGDYILWLLIAGKSKIGYINESTAVYRIRDNSASHSDELEGFLKFHKSVYKAILFFSSYYDRLLERKKYKQILKKSILIYCASKKKYKQLFYYARCFPLAIAAILKEFLRDLIVWVTNRKISLIRQSCRWTD